MTAWKGRSSTTRVVFDGQSLNIVPSATNYPKQTMAFFQWVPFSNMGVGGASFAQNAGTRQYRIADWPTRSRYTIYIICQGTTDLSFDATGAQVYASMYGATDYARSIGYDYVIATTITPAKTAFTAPQETQRLSANSLIKADASAKFNAVCDFAGDSRLSDPNDLTYYDSGGLHWTTAGAGVAAELMRPVLAPALTLVSA